MVMDVDPEETTLAVRASEGDPEALAELAERTRHWLFRCAYGALGHYDDAQDVVAATLFQVCRHAGQVRDPSRMRAWIRVVLQHEIRGHLRRHHSESTVYLETLPIDAHRATALRLDVEAALRQLPRDEARAVALFYLGGVPVAEIARRLARPSGTVKRWLHQGRRRLAGQLEAYQPMPTPPIAAIVSTELDPSGVASLASALRAAGYGEVRLLSTQPVLKQSPAGDSIELHLPQDWRSVRFFILDEGIAGRSAFETLHLIRTSNEGSNAGVCLLVANPAESTAVAAWAAGFDMFLIKPVDVAEFQPLVQRLLRRASVKPGVTP
jgi:RNA polymerase sigma factor (sigma-70 family)